MRSLPGSVSTSTAGSNSFAETIRALFARIRDPAGTGATTYLRLFETEALAAARAWDAMREAKLPLPPLAGLPVSVKDLFDVAGSVTTAGSRALAGDAPAQRDAPVVARLRAAGAIVVGTTNMTEFAFGGLGLNPHYGTPPNPYDRATGRIPGGSSSGAAVSIADGLAEAAIGSDTAGSVRMPAALCGTVGFKPTARRVPLAGAIPLAPSMDSIGPLAATVEMCARIDAVIAGDDDALEPLPLGGLRFAVPRNYVVDDLDPPVAAAFTRALQLLAGRGASIVEIVFPELDELPVLHRQGTMALIEGYAWHRRLLHEKRELYDPRIAARFSTGAAVTAADYIELRRGRARLIDAARLRTAPFDAVLMPTVPFVAPPIADMEQDEASYLAATRRVTRNAIVANVLDRCALSVPAEAPGEPPVGITLMGEALADRRLLSIGASVQRVLTTG